MPDSLTPQEQYMQRGLAHAMTKQARSIKIDNVVLHGIRSDLSISTETPEYGGKKIKRAFQFVLPRTEKVEDLTDGKAVTDDMGRKFVVSSVVGDATSQTLTCVGTWG